jgi:hypothetical protein
LILLLHQESLSVDAQKDQSGGHLAMLVDTGGAATPVYTGLASAIPTLRSVTADQQENATPVASP